MTVLLTTLNAKYIHLNLAIRLLYSLNKDREGLQWKEFTIKEPRADVAKYCSQFNIVAFSCYIWNISQTLEVARLIKQLNPEVKILLGGPEVSYDWEELMQKPEVDYIITGEGEIPFGEFLKHYPDISHIPNLAGKTGGEVRYLPKQEAFNLKNYENIQPYKYEATEELGPKVLYIETSRGCPYKCEFCLASLDNKVRYLPDAHIKNNLLYLMEHGRTIKFLDRTFNIKKDFTLDIFRFILQHHRPENVFQFEITADILHTDIIQFIQNEVPPGLFRFEIGIQTVNKKANLEVSRKQNFDKTKAIIQSLQHKVEMHLDLIVGLPLDYWEDIKFSFEEVFKLFAPELQLGFLKFLKGTPVRYKYEQHGYVFDPEPPYQIIKSNYLSEEELHHITQLEHALEIYWNKKRAINALKYVTSRYSIFDFLLGLGRFFSEQKDYHRYGLQDVYDIIYRYAELHYPEDDVLRQLIAIDYYARHKICPRVQYLQEIERNKKAEILAHMGLNRNKYRHIVIPLNFDYQSFEEGHQITPGTHRLIFQYSGTKKPEVFCVSPEYFHRASLPIF